MNEMIYLYDGSFEGLLCCIFDSYANKEILTAIFSDEDFAPTLFPTRTVSTDAGHASRVLRKIHKLSPYAEELLDEKTPSFDPRLDPKCCWALRHPEFFPVEVNRADYEALLRVPGLGVVSARRILTARRSGPLRGENLPKLGVVMKRAQYFLTANGRMADGLRFTQDSLLRNLIAVEQPLLPQPEMRQLSLFDDAV